MHAPRLLPATPPAITAGAPRKAASGVNFVNLSRPVADDRGASNRATCVNFINLSRPAADDGVGATPKGTIRVNFVNLSPPAADDHAAPKAASCINFVNLSRPASARRSATGCMRLPIRPAPCDGAAR